MSSRRGGFRQVDGVCWAITPGHSATNAGFWQRDGAWGGPGDVRATTTIDRIAVACQSNWVYGSPDNGCVLVTNVGRASDNLGHLAAGDPFPVRI
jgi:hypothetical protein